MEFIQNTPNPAMESEIFNDTYDISKELMERECKNLLSEIERLEMRRELLSNRLKNAMDLAYATVNINDSRLTRKLTEATVRDSAAMRQVDFFLHSAADGDELPSDLIPHNDLPTGQFHSSKPGVFYVGPI